MGLFLLELLLVELLDRRHQRRTLELERARARVWRNAWAETHQ